MAGEVSIHVSEKKVAGEVSIHVSEKRVAGEARDATPFSFLLSMKQKSRHILLD